MQKPYNSSPNEDVNIKLIIRVGSLTNVLCV